MKILVGSKNPTKLEAVKEAFAMYFGGEPEVVSEPVESAAADQPFGDETFKGAGSRARALEKLSAEKGIGADFFVGVEGGILELNGINFNSNVACIIDKNGKAGFGVSPAYQLPDMVIEKISKGAELGKVIDEMTGGKNSGYKGGAVDYFSKGNINRKEMTKLALMMALIPFVNVDLF